MEGAVGVGNATNDERLSDTFSEIEFPIVSGEVEIDEIRFSKSPEFWSVGTDPVREVTMPNAAGEAELNRGTMFAAAAIMPLIMHGCGQMPRQGFQTLRARVTGLVSFLCRRAAKYCHCNHLVTSH